MKIIDSCLTLDLISVASFLSGVHVRVTVFIVLLDSIAEIVVFLKKMSIIGKKS